MNGYNQVTILGTICSDVELRYTATNTPIAAFTIVNNRKYAGKEEAHFFDIKMWGDRAESFHKYHAKGTPAFIVGELRQERWEDKESGKKRSKLVINAHTWSFLPGRKGDSSEPAARHEPDRKMTPTGQKDFLNDAPDFLADDDTPF